MIHTGPLHAIYIAVKVAESDFLLSFAVSVARLKSKLENVSVFEREFVGKYKRSSCPLS